MFSRNLTRGSDLSLKKKTREVHIWKQTQAEESQADKVIESMVIFFL